MGGAITLLYVCSPESAAEVSSSPAISWCVLGPVGVRRSAFCPNYLRSAFAVGCSGVVSGRGLRILRKNGPFNARLMFQDIR